MSIELTEHDPAPGVESAPSVSRIPHAVDRVTFPLSQPRLAVRTLTGLRGAYKRVQSTGSAAAHGNEAEDDRDFSVPINATSSTFVETIGVHLDDVSSSAIQDRQEVQVYLLYLKRSISKLPGSYFSGVLPGIDLFTSLPFERGLTMLTSIARCLVSKPRASIDNIASTLRDSGIICEDALLSTERQNHTRQVIFCISSLLHLLYKPIWSDPNSASHQDRLVIDSEDASCVLEISQSIEMAVRPLQQVRLGFGAILPLAPDDTEPSSSETVLNVSTLNAATLHNVGKISIKWVHTLSSHLDFDQANKQLLMFCLPSFCRLQSFSEETIVASLLRGLPQAENLIALDVPIRASDYLREVLRSYQLLFGDDGSARQRYKKFEKKQVKALAGFRDPFLDDLCRLKDARAERVGKTISQSKQTYSTEADFPIFAPRLLRLQDFVLSQQPRGFWDLWKNKTDMNRWSGLWVATILAVIGLSFGLIQVCLGILQVYYAANPNQRT